MRIYKMFHHTLFITNMFPSFVMILGVALWEYKEYNNVQYKTFGCLNHRVFQFTQFYNSPYS
jgi:hypothetical protein